MARMKAAELEARRIRETYNPVYSVFLAIWKLHHGYAVDAASADVMPLATEDEIAAFDALATLAGYMPRNDA